MTVRRRFRTVLCLTLLAAAGAGEELGGAEARAASGGRVSLSVSVTDRRGTPISGLGEDDFQLLEDGEARRLVTVRPADGPHHLILVEDAAWSSPGDRHRALPPLRDFLLERRRRGDRVSIAWMEDSARQPTARWLCLYSDEEAEVKRAFDTLSRSRSVAFRARQQRGTAPTQNLERAYDALAGALSMAAGDAGRTSVLYLSQALTTALRESRPGRRGRLSPGGDTEATDGVGTVQFLVSLPRTGPLEGQARNAGDRLLGAALSAEVAVYPLVARQTDLGSDLWLASETGGASLSIPQLPSELERLGRQLDGAYELVFERRSAPDSRFHRVKVATEVPRWQLRHARGIRVDTDDETLAARARAAVLLGARHDRLGLEASLARGPETAALELSLPVPESTGSGGETGEVRLILHVVLRAGGQLFSSRQVLRVTEKPGQEDLRLRIPLRLPENTRDLGLALQDGASGHISSLKLEVPPVP